jgi:hypothetical protein
VLGLFRQSAERQKQGARRLRGSVIGRILEATPSHVNVTTLSQSYVFTGYHFRQSQDCSPSHSNDTAAR